MTREYIQQLARRVAKRGDETIQANGNVSENLARLQDHRSPDLELAADLLDRMVNEGEMISTNTLFAALEVAKDDGCLGYELWLAGKIWLEQYCVEGNH